MEKIVAGLVGAIPHLVNGIQLLSNLAAQAAKTASELEEKRARGEQPTAEEITATLDLDSEISQVIRRFPQQN